MNSLQHLVTGGKVRKSPEDAKLKIDPDVTRLRFAEQASHHRRVPPGKKLSEIRWMTALISV